MLTRIDDHANQVPPPRPVMDLPALAPVPVKPERGNAPFLIAVSGIAILLLIGAGMGGYSIWKHYAPGHARGPQPIADATPQRTPTPSSASPTAPLATTPSTPPLAPGEVAIDEALTRSLAKVLQADPSAQHLPVRVDAPFGDRPGISPDNLTPRIMAAAATRINEAVAPAQALADQLTSAGGANPAGLSARSDVTARLALMDQYIEASTHAVTQLSGLAQWARQEGRAAGLSSEQTERVAQSIARSIDQARLVGLRSADAAVVAAQRRALAELHAAWPDWQATGTGVRFRSPASQARHDAAIADARKHLDRLRALQAAAARGDEALSGVTSPQEP